jgi:putative addiction module component (TIGR02574 family)
MGTPLIDIEKLDTEQRLELIEALWESLRPNPDAIPVSGEQQGELDRRLDRMESDDAAEIAWEAVREKIRARLKCDR